MKYVKLKISAMYTRQVREHILAFSEDAHYSEVSAVVEQFKTNFTDNADCQHCNCGTCEGCNSCYCEETIISGKEAIVLSDLKHLRIQYGAEELVSF